MSIQHLNVSPEDAYAVLDQCAVWGHKLSQAIQQEHDAAKGNPTPETIAGWENRYQNWLMATYSELVRIFTSERQALNYLHVIFVSVTYPGQHERCIAIRGHIAARVNILNEDIHFLEDHLNISFTAGRDINVQDAGANNTLYTTNEGY